MRGYSMDPPLNTPGYHFSSVETVMEPFKYNVSWSDGDGDPQNCWDISYHNLSDAMKKAEEMITIGWKIVTITSGI